MAIRRSDVLAFLLVGLVWGVAAVGPFSAELDGHEIQGEEAADDGAPVRVSGSKSSATLADIENGVADMAAQGVLRSGTRACAFSGGSGYCASYAYSHADGRLVPESFEGALLHGRVVLVWSAQSPYTDRLEVRVDVAPRDCRECGVSIAKAQGSSALVLEFEGLNRWISSDEGIWIHVVNPKATTQAGPGSVHAGAEQEYELFAAFTYRHG